MTLPARKTEKKIRRNLRAAKRKRMSMKPTENTRGAMIVVPSVTMRRAKRTTARDMMKSIKEAEETLKMKVI